jgi:hypothetical protein
MQSSVWLIASTAIACVSGASAASAGLSVAAKPSMSLAGGWSPPSGASMFLMIAGVAAAPHAVLPGLTKPSRRLLSTSPFCSGASLFVGSKVRPGKDASTAAALLGWWSAPAAMGMGDASGEEPKSGGDRTPNRGGGPDSAGVRGDDSRPEGARWSRAGAAAWKAMGAIGSGGPSEASCPPSGAGAGFGAGSLGATGEPKFGGSNIPKLDASASVSGGAFGALRSSRRTGRWPALPV